MNRRDMLGCLGGAAAALATARCGTPDRRGGGGAEAGAPRRVPAVLIDPEVSHQTLLGWQGAAQIGQWRHDTTQEFFDSYKEPLWDALVALGMTSMQVGAWVGMESDADWFSIQEEAYVSGSPDREQLWRRWRRSRSHPLPTGRYYWSFVDTAVINVVEPMRRRILARGERPHVMLTLGDQNNDERPAGTYLAKERPDRVATMLVALFRHIEDTYGWRPDAVQLINEPDHWVAAYTPGQLAEQARRVGEALENAGYAPDLLIPGCERPDRVPAFFEAAWNLGAPEYPNRRYVKGISYHTYQNPRPRHLEAIRALAERNGLYGFHTEWLRLGAAGVHELMARYDASGVCKLALAFTNPDRDPESGDWLNVTRPGGEIVHSRTTRLIRQYTQYVRPGAVRKGVRSERRAPEATAWLNPDGRWVVVAQTSAAGRFAVTGLPPGRYGISYAHGVEPADAFASPRSTTVTAWDRHLPDVMLGAGETVEVEATGAGYYTIYGRPEPG